MTAKKYLGQLRNIDTTINVKNEQLAKLRERSQKITQTISDNIRGNEISDKIGKTVANIVDLENSINDDIGRLIDLQKEVAEVIKKVDDSTLRNLLELRYISFKTWEQIAVDMNYSYFHVTSRLHNNALNAVSEILERCY